MIRVGEILEEYFHSGYVYRLTGDEYLVLMENTSYEDFTKQIYAVHSRLDNISLGLDFHGICMGKGGDRG